MPRPIRAAFKIPYGAAFGAVRAGGKRKHEGTDYHAPEWTPIYGVADGGRVAHIGENHDPNLGLGHNITVVYPGGVKTLDAHMVVRTPLAYGQTVNANTVIGYLGKTGNAVNASPPGPHDHHQRWEDGVLVNPEVAYGSEPAGGTGKPIEEDDMYSDEDRARDAASAERTRQLEAALTGKINGVPVGLNPDVNFGQSVIYGLQEARKGIQKIIDTPAGGIDVDRLAELIVSKLPTGSISKAEVTAAVIDAAPAIGEATRAAIIKE